MRLVVLDAILCSDHWIVGRRWLRRKDIKSGVPQLARIQRLGQVFFNDQAAAGTIDQDARLHLCNA